MLHTKKGYLSQIPFLSFVTRMGSQSDSAGIQVIRLESKF